MVLPHLIYFSDMYLSLTPLHSTIPAASVIHLKFVFYCHFNPANSVVSYKLAQSASFLLDR